MARCSGNLLPPSPPAEKATASQDQPWKSRTDDGTWRHKAPDLTTAEVHSVDVKIGPLVFDSRNQRRLSIREPALRRDEGRIVDPRVSGGRSELREIEGHGTVGPGGHSQREPGK